MHQSSGALTILLLHISQLPWQPFPRIDAQISVFIKTVNLQKIQEKNDPLSSCVEHIHLGIYKNETMPVVNPLYVRGSNLSNKQTAYKSLHS